ncbi:MAG: hypothetical protein Q7K45_06190, partial [Nanoarchaeota archaeon]|nr:hypothetical protein [Nanoarchaeota archaeon]
PPIQIEFGIIRPILTPSNAAAAALAAKHAAQGVGNAIGGIGSAIGGWFESAESKRKREEEHKIKQEAARLSLDLKTLEGEPLLNYLNNTTFHIMATLEANKIKGFELHNYDTLLGKQRVVYGVISSEPPMVLNDQGDIEFKIPIPLPQKSSSEKSEVIMTLTIHAPQLVTENGEQMYEYKASLELTGFPSKISQDDSIVLRNHLYPLTLRYHPLMQQGEMIKEMIVGKNACCDEAGNVLPETPGQDPQKCIKCKDTQSVSTELKELQLYFEVNIDRSFGGKKIRFSGPDGIYEDDQVYDPKPDSKQGFCIFSCITQ